MVRAKPTWRSCMRPVSLRSWGGVTGALLLVGTSVVLAQQVPIVIHRGPQPSPPAAPAQDSTTPPPASVPAGLPPAAPIPQTNVPPALPSLPDSPAPPAVQPGVLNLVPTPPSTPPPLPEVKPIPVPPLPVGWPTAPPVAKVNNPIPAPLPKLDLQPVAPEPSLFPPRPQAPPLVDTPPPPLPATPVYIPPAPVADEKQVRLRVTVAEVNRAAAHSIGLNCGFNRHDGSTIFATRSGQLPGLTDMSGVSVPAFLDDGQIGVAIDALRGMNLARSLAEPQLVALNGHPARFDTGGTLPTPSVKGVEFVPYGVSLQVTPNVLDGNCLRLAVQAEVSAKDDGRTVNVGHSLPGLNSRTFQTTVELREGQTLAVVGLIQNSFASASRRSTPEQELIVLITPELVHPREGKDAPLVPRANLIQPSDLEFYLKPGPVDPAQRKRVTHCEELFIAGPQGFSNGRE
jgi:hypothetical protein